MLTEHSENMRLSNVSSKIGSRNMADDLVSLIISLIDKYVERNDSKYPSNITFYKNKKHIVLLIIN
jgi:hypothetical protein